MTLLSLVLRSFLLSEIHTFHKYMQGGFCISAVYYKIMFLILPTHSRGNSKNYSRNKLYLLLNPRVDHNFQRNVRPKMVVHQEKRGNDLPSPLFGQWWEVVLSLLLGDHYFRPHVPLKIVTNLVALVWIKRWQIYHPLTIFEYNQIEKQ